MATAWRSSHPSVEVSIYITDQPISIADASVDNDPGSGAVVTFAGVVRNHNDGHSVTGLLYECYEAKVPNGKLLTSVQEIIDAIKTRVPIWKKERYADETTQWLR